jgi:DNA-directed RNA polymerase subunit RPC12/RpoP
MLNWLTRLRQNFLALFGWNKEVEGILKVEEVTPEIEISRRPGLSCPECRTKLVISMESLVNYEPVRCHGCGLELTIDQEKSKQSIESLRKLQNGLSKAEKIRADGQL